MALMDVNSITRLSEQAFLLKRRWTTLSSASGADVMGPIWMLTHIRLAGPSVYWIANGRKVHPSTPQEFYAFFPPFSWAMEYAQAGTEWEMSSILSIDDAPSNAPKNPSLLKTDRMFPSEPGELEGFFKDCAVEADLSLCSEPGPMAARTKEYIDKGFQHDIGIEEIARKMNSSGAYLSRQFKSSYGFSPNYYKKRLKITVATFALTSGKTPIEAAAMAGYQDLSRFYKQFGELMKITPKSHQGT